MFEPQAIARNSASAYRLPCANPSVLTRPVAIDTKISVVTTCDRTELISAEASPKATSSRQGLAPTNRDDAMRYATRRVRPCTCIAWAMISAASRKMHTQLAHGLNAASTLRTPQSTSMAMAASDVAGMGIASDTHQVTVQRKIPRVRMPTGVTSCRGGTISVRTNRSGPSHSPTSCFRFSN